MSQWIYRCPHCNGLLNPGDLVILVAVRGGAQMIVAFHSEPGNYEIFAPPEARFHPDDLWDFFCPVCRTNLESERNDNLCELALIEEGERKVLLFSRVAGEHATIVVREDSAPSHHGPHRERYEDITIKIAGKR